MLLLVPKPARCGETGGNGFLRLHRLSVSKAATPDSVGIDYRTRLGLGDFDLGMASNKSQDELVTISDQQTLQNNDDMEVEQLRQRIDTVSAPM